MKLKLTENTPDTVELGKVGLDLYSLKYLKTCESSKQVSKELYAAAKALVDAAKVYSDIYYEEITKPQNAARQKAEDERIAKSGMAISLTPKQAELIARVLGQMSDGYWENTRGYDIFWKNMSVKNNTLRVDIQKMKVNASYSAYNKICTEFADETSVKKFFAKKAQIVQNADIRDNCAGMSKAEAMKEPARYLDGELNKTIGDVQEVINSLK